MTASELRTKSKDEVKAFIRKRLSFSKKILDQLRYVSKEEFQNEHRRFEMSGYESQTGECTLHNISIINEFADLGIYDYTTYLFLDFYKGSPTLYMQYFRENENLKFEYDGYSTTDIIYEIFEKTIFSDKTTRRRA